MIQFSKDQVSLLLSLFFPLEAGNRVLKLLFSLSVLGSSYKQRDKNYLNCYYFPVSKIVPLEITYKYFATRRNYEQISAYLTEASTPLTTSQEPTSPKPVCWTVGVQFTVC